MIKNKVWVSLAVSLFSTLSAQAAFGATITLNSTCSFAKAVAWINNPGVAQSGCTRSGAFGSNDTIIVGLNNQEFTIDSAVEIKKTLTLQSWSFSGTLKTTNPFMSTAIKIAVRDITVRFSAITLRGVSGNATTGILVDGTADTHESFIPKLILDSSRITGFRRSGIFINQGGVDMNATTLDDNSNTGSVGGAVRIETATKYGELDADGCLFSGNSAQQGGAIYNHGVMNINEGRFYGNHAASTGGVVFAVSSAVNYYTAFNYGGDFDSNTAASGGFAIAGGAARVEFSGGTPFTGSNNTSGSDNPPNLCQNPFGQQSVPAPGCFATQP